MTSCTNKLKLRRVGWNFPKVFQCETIMNLLKIIKKKYLVWVISAKDGSFNKMHREMFTQCVSCCWSYTFYATLTYVRSACSFVLFLLLRFFNYLQLSAWFDLLSMVSNKLHILEPLDSFFCLSASFDFSF